MRKRIIRSLTATVLITSIMGMTVLADVLHRKSRM